MTALPITPDPDPSELVIANTNLVGFFDPKFFDPAFFDTGDSVRLVVTKDPAAPPLLIVN